MVDSKTDTKPGDSGATETKDPKATRERRFPIRQFSMLLDEFLTAHDTPNSVEDLKEEVDKALLEHYKKTG